MALRSAAASHDRSTVLMSTNGRPICSDEDGLRLGGEPRIGIQGIDRVREPCVDLQRQVPEEPAERLPGDIFNSPSSSNTRGGDGTATPCSHPEITVCD